MTQVHLFNYAPITIMSHPPWLVVGTGQGLGRGVDPSSMLLGKDICLNIWAIVTVHSQICIVLIR